MSRRILTIWTSVVAVGLLLCASGFAQTPPRCYGARIHSKSDRIEAQHYLAIIASELEKDPWMYAFPFSGDCTFQLIDSPLFSSKPFVVRQGHQRANRVAYRRSVREFLQWWRGKVKSI